MFKWEKNRTIKIYICAYIPGSLKQEHKINLQTDEDGANTTDSDDEQELFGKFERKSSEFPVLIWTAGHSDDFCSNFKFPVVHQLSHFNVPLSTK